MPYRDFGVEYPPGALAPFVVPALVTSSTDGYDAAFATLMVIALIAAAVLIVLSLVALGGSTARTSCFRSRRSWPASRCSGRSC